MSQTNPNKPVLLLTDSDVDGLSGHVVGLYTLRSLHTPHIHYAHFATSSQPQQPGTSATQMDLLQVLNYLVADPSSVHIIDVPPPREVARRVTYIDMIRRLRAIGVDVEIYDVTDHAAPDDWRQIASAGAALRLVPDGYSAKLQYAHSRGVFDSELEKWALLGSIADFDESVAEKTSRELERTVAEIVDPVYKFVMQQHTDIKPLIPRYGSAGAVAEYVVARNMSMDEFIRFAESLSSQLPPNQRVVMPREYHATTFGVIVDSQRNQIPPGLQWKTAWKTAFETNSYYSVVYNVPPPPGRQGVGVIVASYWRQKRLVAQAIDNAVNEISRHYGASVVGHSGARSLLFPPGTDTSTIAYEIARLIESNMTVSRVTHLINDTTVASAVLEEYRQISRQLAEILSTMQQMYREYLELKRRQVELLEHATQRVRYD